MAATAGTWIPAKRAAGPSVNRIGSELRGREAVGAAAELLRFRKGKESS